MSNKPFSAFSVKNFSLFIAARLCFVLATQIQSTALQWQVYDITKSKLSIGILSLAEVIPNIVMALFAGYIIDRFNRKMVVLVSTALLLFSGVLLYYISFDLKNIIDLYGVVPIYISAAIIGIARSFIGPGFFSLLPMLVPRSEYANASTWNVTIWHTGAVMGPLIGGFMVYHLTYAYAAVMALIIGSGIFVATISLKEIITKKSEENIWSSLATGISFVKNNQVILGAMSLDLFAVLFGGAVAMLAPFSEEILHQPTAFGVLKSAPAIGAVLSSLIIAWYPKIAAQGKTGRNLFISIFAFGLATVCFAFTTSVFWAVFWLALTGAFDNVSVVVRHTVLQLETPEEMRGRVAAVNSIFINSSNEIGGFESSITAEWFGLKRSIWLGGVLTCGVVGYIYKKAPKLARLELE